MYRRVSFLLFSASLLLTAYPAVWAANIVGDVIKVGEEQVTAEFPVPVYTRAMLTVLAGSGDAVAGTAVVQSCVGSAPPYLVTGKLLFAADSLALTAGKKCYVNSINTGLAPSIVRGRMAAGGRSFARAGDLRLYYYAAGQTIGYGALGLGYERRINLFLGASIELDAGITGIGNVNAKDPSLVRADQLMKSANGRFRLDFGPRAGIYAGYRWTEGRGDTDRWDVLTKRLEGKRFAAESKMDEGVVQTLGIEYGFAVRPSEKVEFMGGFIPCYRTDFGSLGVQDKPAYSAELRLGLGSRVARLRGVMTENYWIADMGITIR